MATAAKKKAAQKDQSLLKEKIALGKEKISLIHYIPDSFSSALVLANGAGADMSHTFMRTFAGGLCERGFFVTTFNFPYQEKKRKAPDKPPVLEAAYEAVWNRTAEKSQLPHAKVFAGGKSMGGRIASQIAERLAIERLVFLGYPLHPPGSPEKLRDAHLYSIPGRMLFVYGTRDPFCTPELFRRVTSKLANAKVWPVEEGGHSLEIPKRSTVYAGQPEVYRLALDEIAAFLKAR